MSAKDIFHDKVKNALIKDGWTITDDPYSLKWDNGENLFIDLAAERVIAAEKNNEKIAVEIKTFIGKSTMYDLHLAVGQFMVYQIALEEKEPDRVLFLAVPMEILQEISVCVTKSDARAFRLWQISPKVLEDVPIKNFQTS